MEDKILAVIQDLTELPSSHPELTSVGYCYAQDILDSFDISLSGLLKLARDNGYDTFVVYPDKDSESSKKYIIAQDTFDIDLLYNDLKNIYDTEPGIVSLTESKNSKLSFKVLRENINSKIKTNKSIIESINNCYIASSKADATKKIQEHLGLSETDTIDIEHLDLFSNLTNDRELAVLIESYKKSDTPLIKKIPNKLIYSNLNEAVRGMNGKMVTFSQMLSTLFSEPIITLLNSTNPITYCEPEDLDKLLINTFNPKVFFTFTSNRGGTRKNEMNVEHHLDYGIDALKVTLPHNVHTKLHNYLREMFYLNYTEELTPIYEKYYKVPYVSVLNTLNETYSEEIIKFALFENCIRAMGDTLIRLNRFDMLSNYKDNEILLGTIKFLQDNQIDIPEDILNDLSKHLPKSKYTPTNIANNK